MVAGNAEDKVSNVQAMRAVVCKKERCKKVWEIIYGAIKAPHFEAKRDVRKSRNTASVQGQKYGRKSFSST